ncbi:hypothetical protein GQ44DRAFT_749261 [Phaeosphaeriaceae sp. PMI808]|nr:hypothetical protein GQ44DRAFT_749261 [Phaeosphaeriaceae sp. PMI808]
MTIEKFHHLVTMASKSSSPGPNMTTTPAVKQARSRKATTKNTEGRAGSAGGIVLEREKEKGNTVKAKSKPPTTTTSKPLQDPPPEPTRRKPRKLNKDPTSTATPQTKTTAETTEIEALKSRVRGLEVKVEELYKNGTIDRSARSPRRRGKGRKNSSQATVPTLGNNSSSSSSKAAQVDDDDNDIEDIGRGDETGEEAVEELVRLEGELEIARQDLNAAATARRSKIRHTNEEEEGEEEDVPRTDEPNNRHVTLSGSYRIPLPSSVSVTDVKQIQSGVSAAQNVARSFLEQRRVAARQSAAPQTGKAGNRPSLKSVSSSMEIVPVGEGGAGQSWGEWIGGYSLAVSRAVRNIEHEAVVESQRGGGKGGKGKRPGVKARLSGEQVDGLMR